LLQYAVRFFFRSIDLLFLFNREFHQSQRGGFIDPRFMDQQRFPKRTNYPPSTRKILAIILPISSFVVLTGIGVLVFLYYKKFRNEQNRARRPAGAIRLEDTYSSKSIHAN
jgi:hypothetical protein